jgi:hypothetical protein
MSGWSDLDILELMFRHKTLGQSAAQVGLAMICSRSAVCGMVKRVMDSAPQVEALRFRDHERFTILERVLGGASAEAVAKDFAKVKGFAVHRMAVLYLVWVILNDLSAAGGDDCIRPDNSDVRRLPGWWRAGEVRGIAA